MLPSQDSQPVLTSNLVLLEGSTQFFPALIACLDAAQHSVHLETYIFDTVNSGAEVAEALERAATRGVKVRLLVDGFGTPALPKEWRARFQTAGVDVRVFEPIVTLGFFIPSQWRRLHRKLCAIDGGTYGAVAFCGGINVLDDFYDPNYGALTGARFDFCVQVDGELARAVQTIAMQLWDRLSQSKSNARGTLNSVKTAMDFFNPPSINNPSYVQKQLQKAQLVLRDNVTNRAKIERAYLKAIGESRHEVIIANAYFLPGAKLRKALILAARRGVKVQLLLQGKYEYFMQYHAARPIYGSLLVAGVEVHEYASSYLHAKVAVIDGVWATVGSSNLEPLSLLLAREANIVVRDAAFANTLRLRLIEAMQTQGKQVSAESFAARPLKQRMLDHLALLVMRVALWAVGKRY